MAEAIRTRMRAQDWTLLILLSVLWGGSFLFVGISVKELTPLTIVALRVAVAACVLYLVLRLTGVPLPMQPVVWRAFFGMGLLNNVVPFTLIVWGQSHIASGLASILNATTPLFTVLVAHVLTIDEKLTRQRLVGAAVGFSGVAVMVGSDAMGAFGGHVLAQLAVLAAALSYGFAGVFGRRFRDLGVPPIATAAGQLTASSAMLIPLALVVDRPWMLVMPSGVAIAALLGLALLSTALAYVLFFRLLASAGAANASLVTFLIPVSAILLGVTILGEELEARHVLGMVLIATGLALIDGRLAAGIRPTRTGAVSGSRAPNGSD